MTEQGLTSHHMKLLMLVAFVHAQLNFSAIFESDTFDAASV